MFPSYQAIWPATYNLPIVVTNAQMPAAGSEAPPAPVGALAFPRALARAAVSSDPPETRREGGGHASMDGATQ